jgi:hypothetical protein
MTLYVLYAVYGRYTYIPYVPHVPYIGKEFLRYIDVYLKDYSPYLDSSLFIVNLRIIRVNLLGNLLHYYSCRLFVYLYTRPINKPTVVFPIRLRNI